MRLASIRSEYTEQDQQENSFGADEGEEQYYDEEDDGGDGAASAK